MLQREAQLSLNVRKSTIRRLQKFTGKRFCCTGGSEERRQGGITFPTIGFFDCISQQQRWYRGWRSDKASDTKATLWFMHMEDEQGFVVAVCRKTDVVFVRQPSVASLFVRLEQLQLLYDMKAVVKTRLMTLLSEHPAGCILKEGMHLHVQPQSVDHLLLASKLNKVQNLCTSGCNPCSKGIAHWQCIDCAALAMYIYHLACSWSHYSRVICEKEIYIVTYDDDTGTQLEQQWKSLVTSPKPGPLSEIYALSILRFACGLMNVNDETMKSAEKRKRVNHITNNFGEVCQIASGSLYIGVFAENESSLARRSLEESETAASLYGIYDSTTSAAHNEFLHPTQYPDPDPDNALAILLRHDTVDRTTTT